MLAQSALQSIGQAIVALIGRRLGIEDVDVAVVLHAGIIASFEGCLLDTVVAADVPEAKEVSLSLTGLPGGDASCGSARLLPAERGHPPGSLLAAAAAAETGPDQVRTDDLLNAIEALCQLSYEPLCLR